jgi:NAD(P) transhydrogenase subunit alpha
MSIIISVPRETRAGEQRVALVPEIVKKLIAMGAAVQVQSSAGELAGYSDGDYSAAGASICSDADLMQSANIVLTVNPPDHEQIKHLPEHCILIGYLNPWSETERFTALQNKHVSAFSMEMVPRISRAQAMDTLSSQASIAGYKAVLMAASMSGKFLPMLTTAAGTVRPSKVLIIGAGVAGLQAIATARSRRAYWRLVLSVFSNTWRCVDWRTKNSIRGQDSSRKILECKRKLYGYTAIEKRIPEY